MELTFLNSCDGNVIKRKQSQRACACCRQKKVSSKTAFFITKWQADEVKKRCYHYDSRLQASTQDQPLNVPDTVNVSRANFEDLEQHQVTTGPPTAPRDERPNATLFQEVEEQMLSTSGISDAPAAAAEDDSNSRHFACDSNPVMTFLEEEGSRLQRGRSQRGDVGGWIRDEDTITQGKGPRVSSLSTPNELHQPKIVGLLPSKQKQEALIDIYFRRIHPILPLVDESDIRAQFQKGALPPQLIQSICLVASKDRSAASFLCLGQDSTVLTLEKFSNILYHDIMQNMPRKAERKKITAIQVLALLSLHEWGPTGFEDCSLHLMQAIHHAQTIGLHLVRPDDQQSSTSLKALFWCLWSLDRWNAAINGRPVMIHDRDMGQKVDDILPLFESPFRTWLSLTDRLGEVIRFYRPIVDGNDEQELDLPSFEELVDSSNAWDIPPDVLESLDMFYHGVIILSSHSKGLQGRSQPRMSRIRQSHSIFSIASLIRKQDVQVFLPVPMAAYALSLAFSITYRQLREEKLPSSRQTAKEHLHLFYQCLRTLDSTWWSAAIMTRLGNRVLNDTQRGRNQERSTASEFHQIRSSSQGMSTHSFSRQTLPDVHRLSHSGVGRTQASEENEGTYMNVDSIDHRQIGSDLSTNFHDLLDSPNMMSGNIEDFDLFINNFPDINFPRSYCDQFLLDFDVPNLT